MVVGLALPSTSCLCCPVSTAATSAAHVLQIPSAKCPAKIVPVPPKQVELAANAPGAAYPLLPALICLLLAATVKLKLIVSIHGVNCCCCQHDSDAKLLAWCCAAGKYTYTCKAPGTVRQMCSSVGRLGTRRRRVLAWSSYASA